MAVNRNITYINRDFSSFRASLINYSKTYFPTTYTDFTESSPGMMFMEMAAYIGDVLSFYQDNQFQETFLQYARETNNLFDLAYMFGYKPNVTGVATAAIDFYQQLPAITSGSIQIPDYSYSLLIPENTQIASSNNSDISFLIQDPVDFTVSSSLDPTSVSVYDQTGATINYFLLKKSRKAISATIKSTTFSFGSPVEFDTRIISDENIIGILDITDNTTGKKWYEVPYLGEDTIYQPVKNTNTNDPNTYTDPDAPYILQLEQVARRFATRFVDSGSLQVQFGAGTTSDITEEIVPNADNVGLGLPFEKDKLTTAFSPQNFIFNNTYGIAPSNTTLTVRYLTGGGVVANVPANSLTSLNTSPIRFINTGLNSTTANYVFNSVSSNNPTGASGGGDGDTSEEIRQNAISNFNTQLRNVTQDDYLVRALSLPSNYGTIAKAYAMKSQLADTLPGQIPNVLDMYILTFNSNGNLTTASNALKQNLSTYLSQYRVLGDSVNIKDAYIINIGVDFEITVRPNFNSNEILRNCLFALQDYFALDNWQINEPISLKEVNLLLDAVEGVQTVKNVVITNKVGGNYSQYAYDTVGATQNNVIYPSIDPMIFEVKFPATDIKGKIVNI
jgi:hypothetical protein